MHGHVNVKLAKNQAQCCEVGCEGSTLWNFGSSASFQVITPIQESVTFFDYELMQMAACYWLRPTLFWAVTQQVVVIPYRRFGTTYRPHLQGSRFQDSWIQDSCPPTIRPTTRCVIAPEERCSHLLRVGSLKSRLLLAIIVTLIPRQETLKLYWASL
jgi:hypothetical protein